MHATLTPTPALQRVFGNQTLDLSYDPASRGFVPPAHLCGFPIDRAAMPVTPYPTRAEPRVCVDKGTKVDFATVAAIVTPENTIRESSGNVGYHGLDYGHFFSLVMDANSAALGRPCRSFDAVVACDGAQVYAQMVWDHPTVRGMGYSVIARSSHDRSIMPTIANGVSPFICANGIFSGDNMVGAKHTLNIGAKLYGAITDQALGLESTFRTIVERLERYSGVPVTDDLFYGVCGIMKGKGLITSTMMNRAMEYWDKCHAGKLFDEHATQDLAAALQAFTGSLNRESQPSRVCRNHNAVTSVLDHLVEGRLGSDELTVAIAQAQAFTVAEA